ncbi:MAG: hypothetical protein H0W25_16140 [Acidimicrobiia bacterium]|nr:hypothetical protein [Acidimicrobiia bacterium]
MGDREFISIEEMEKLPIAERHRIVEEGFVTDLSDLDPEFLARIRRRGRELVEERGIAVPPEE